MHILQTHIHRVTRDRDFGRIEAIVSVHLQDTLLEAPRTHTILASVPMRADTPLRTRLINEANRVAALLHSRADTGPVTELRLAA